MYGEQMKGMMKRAAEHRQIGEAGRLHDFFVRAKDGM